MEISKLFLSILNFFEAETSEYFKTVTVSNQKTDIKFGSIDNENLNINFFIKGELNSEVTTIESKMKALFNTDTDLSTIDVILKGIKQPTKISFTPFLKISRETEPLLHAFRVSIKFNYV